jgi:hypothetical protein
MIMSADFCHVTMELYKYGILDGAGVWSIILREHVLLVLLYARMVLCSGVYISRRSKVEDICMTASTS